MHSSSSFAPVTVNSFVYRFITAIYRSMYFIVGGDFNNVFSLQHFTAEYLAVVWRSLHRDVCVSEDWRGIGVLPLIFVSVQLPQALFKALEVNILRMLQNSFPCSEKLVLIIF